MGRIIVIEDNPVYSTYVCTLLEKNGFQTRSAGSLSSARKLLAGCEEDDISLPTCACPTARASDCCARCRMRAWDSRSLS